MVAAPPPPAKRQRGGRGFMLLQVLSILLVASLIPGNDAQGTGDPAASGSDSSWQVAGKFIAVVVLVLSSALFSGLTLGLLGLDKIGLEIVAKSDDEKLAKYARRIQPMRANGNLLLCTLLLGNVSVNALLSILLTGLLSEIMAFVISTVVITIFGEIIPQAVCSRHALRIGSAVVPVVRLILVLFWPLAKPLSLMLDCILGEELGTIHTRTELQQLLEIHVKHGALDVETGRELAGALHYKDKKVKDCMTPKDKVYMLSMKEKLNFKTINSIFTEGYSRIPVYGNDRDDIMGLLFTKDLIFVDPEDETSIKEILQIFGRVPQVVWPDQSLGEVIKIFKKGGGHMALVKDVNSEGAGDPFYEVKGIITLEDIIEEMIGDEIMDETDAEPHLPTPLSTGFPHSSVNLARLALLNAASTDTSLSKEEAMAVTAHLSQNVPQLSFLDKEIISSIVHASPVVDIDRQEPGYNGDEYASHDELLYKRGKVATHCTLILTGKVEVMAGKDGFLSDAGPWSVLAADALVGPPGTYRPDFSARVASEHARVVRITRNAIELLSKNGHAGGRRASPHFGAESELPD